MFLKTRTTTPKEQKVMKKRVPQALHLDITFISLYYPTFGTKKKALVVTPAGIEWYCRET
jgi:hypothetical protein